MRVEPGRIYLVRLVLFNAKGIGSSWLVAAFAATFPKLEVADVVTYTGEEALVRTRWRGPVPGEVAEGATVSAFVTGLPLPGQVVPKATIQEVVPSGKDKTIEQLTPNAVKLVFAGVIMLATWYISDKIATKS